jgi:Kef-type K+ transport system membrane component KefB
MTYAVISPLVLIAAAAVLAPVISEQTRGLRVPSVVIELALGILIGPDVLKLTHPNEVISAFSDMGLTFLMFLAGFELDLNRVKGQPLRLASLGWLLSLALGLAFAFALVSTGLALDTLIVGLSLTTTALGTLLPVLGDAGAKRSSVPTCSV